jgi:hypothetical protein
MAEYTNITQDEMADFLGDQGFLQILLPGVTELVYARRANTDDLSLSLRVYTGIAPSGESRDVGEDAIRCVIFWRKPSGDIVKVATTKRVHRVKGWRKNLQDRLDKIGVEKRCECGAPMIRRKAKAGRGSEFYGCSTFPECRKTSSV